MKKIEPHDKEFDCDIQAPCFQALSPEEIELVKSSRTQVLFRRGDNLTKQGAFASYVLFIVSGLAKQYVEDDSTRNFNIRIIVPGEFTGLSSVFTRNTFDYTIVALTECRAFLIEKETIAEVVRKNGEFGFKIIKRYSEQNGNLYGAIRFSVFRQMNGRIAETLLRLNRLKNDYPEIFQLLSRKDIADFAAITTESTIKMLKSFEKDGLIKLIDKDIVILKENELIEISNKG